MKLSGMRDGAEIPGQLGPMEKRSCFFSIPGPLAEVLSHEIS